MSSYLIPTFNKIRQVNTINSRKMILEQGGSANTTWFSKTSISSSPTHFLYLWTKELESVNKIWYCVIWIHKKSSKKIYILYKLRGSCISRFLCSLITCSSHDGTTNSKSLTLTWLESLRAEVLTLGAVAPWGATDSGGKNMTKPNTVVLTSKPKEQLI